MTANSIYLGNVVTVDDAQPTAEAVAVIGGRIAGVGARDEMLAQHKGPSTHASSISAEIHYYLGLWTRTATTSTR